jgi:osmoprotectant transport system ATP-binding protein
VRASGGNYRTPEEPDATPGQSTPRAETRRTEEAISLISFEHVTKRYPGSAVPALNQLDLEIPDGQTMVLVGPSGCGKTTSLRMINRMVDPTEGRIFLDGRDIQQIDPAKLRRGIGYVIQHAGLFPHRTIEDNIGTVPMLVGWGKQKARNRARELMDLVGLEAAMARRYPHQLSGGQQQRVGVARALAADPPVLLMDEPFSAVDPIVRASLQDELLRIQAELRKTVVFVTHDVEEAIKVGDRVAVFRPGGTLVQVDPPATLLARPADDYVADFLGFDRGIRRLSFFPASTLQLDSTPVITDQAKVAEAIGRAKEAGQSWLLLVTNPGRLPRGWVSLAALEQLPVGGSLAEAPAEGGGHTFNVATDSLRAALDATILSPSGQAAGVDGDGHVIGVTSYDRILVAIQALTTGNGDDRGPG